MKKKFLSLTLALMVVLASTGCSKTSAPAGSTGKPDAGTSVSSSGTQSTGEAEFILKIAGTYNEESFMGIEANDYFKPYVEENSNGRIKVEVYCNSVLGSDRELIEAMQLNTVQAAIAPVNVIANFNMPKLNAISMPYLFHDREDAYAQLDGEFGEYMKEDLPEVVGIRALKWSESAIRNLSNSKRTITSPDDCKGLKFRVMEAAIDMAIIESLGGSPTPMAFNELYTGLQQKTVDGQDNGLVMTYQMKFYEVQKYYTVTEQYFLANGLVVSELFWQSLPEDLQQVVADGAEYALTEGRKIVVEQEETCIPVMEQAGMEITYLSDEQRDAFKDATKPVWDRIGEIVKDEKAIEMATDLYNR